MQTGTATGTGYGYREAVIDALVCEICPGTVKSFGVMAKHYGA